jgi:hypothetical protein
MSSGAGWSTPESDTYRIVDGSRRDLQAEVWYCDDDVCQCSQLTITARFTHKLGPWNPRMTVWAGEFQTDGEQFSAEGVEDWKAACAEVGLPEPTQCDWMLPDLTNDTDVSHTGR